MPESNKALRAVRSAEIVHETLDLVETSVPSPGEGQVLVQIYLRPVNPTDLVRLRSSNIHANEAAGPVVPGVEGVGRVVRNGPGCHKFAVGQRVVGTPFPFNEGRGTWQQYLVVQEDQLMVVPDAVKDLDAAQFLVNPVTAVVLVEQLGIPKGEYLLQTAAGSVLGRQIIAFAKHIGLKTINVVRRAAQKEELLSLGADEVISTSDEDVAERINQITDGKGAYAAIEAVGGELFQQIVHATRPRGTVVSYGVMSGITAQFLIPDLLVFNKVLQGFYLLNWLLETPAETREATFKRVLDLIATGVIKPYSGTVYPLEKYAEAIIETEKEGRGGKVFMEG